MLDRWWKWLAALVAGAVVVGLVVWSITEGEEPAALALVGAVLAAGLAAWTAAYRLRQQLSAAADRHARELEHDREQRAIVRAHERDLAALADLRATLDDTVVVVDEAGAVLPRTDIGAEALLVRLAESARRVDGARSRLMLRLDSRSPTVEALLELSTACRELGRTIDEVFASGSPDDDDAAHQAQRWRLMGLRAVVAFHGAAVEVTDSVAARLAAGGALEPAQKPSNDVRSRPTEQR